MRRAFKNDPLKDLDLELELLKRKRQVLQEKRQIMEEQREFDRVKQHHSPWVSNTNESVLPFAQTSFTSNVGFGNAKNFQNHPTGSGKRGGGRGGGRGNTFASRSFGTKRPAPIDNSWNPPEKRFAGSFRGGSAKKQKQAYIPKSFSEKPLPRPAALSKGEGGASFTKKTDSSLFLRPNVPTSNQLMGRLELLLGHLLKHVKSICQAPPIKITTFSNESLFSVKQEIRARIQSALLNKEVSGSIPCNLVHYRKMYPTETDQELVDMLIAPPPVNSTKAQEKGAEQKKTVRPGAELFRKYIKNKFDDVLKMKLSEMFEKLQKLYDEEAKKTDEGTKIPDGESKKPDEESKKPDEESKKPDEESKKPDEESKKPDEESKKPDEESTKPDEESTKPDEESKKPDEESKKPDEVEKAPCESGKANGSETAEKSEIADTKDTLSPEEREFDAKLEPLIRNKLYTLLPQYKHFLKNMLKTPQLLNKIIEQYEKGETPVVIEEDKETASESVPEDDQNKDSSQDQTAPYVARVVGHPCLPARDVMKEFLNEFKPISIKKYSWAHNVLYVALPDAKCFNALMKANETSIGNIRILVKRQNVENYKNKKSSDKTDSDKITKTNGESKTNDNNETTGDKTQENTSDDVLQEKANKENTENEHHDLLEVNNTIEVIDLDEASNDHSGNDDAKNLPNDVDSASNDVDMNEIGVDKDDKGNNMNVSDDKKDLDHSLDVDKDKSVKCDQQENIKETDIIDDGNNVEKEVSNESVVGDAVVDVADEGWNTDAKDDWADLKETNTHNEVKDEPPTPVRVTRSTRRMTADNK